MTSRLYPKLQSALCAFVARRSAQSAVGQEELTAELEEIWRPHWQAYENSTSSSPDKRYEVVKSILELLGRDVVVAPVINGELAEPDEDDTPAREAFIRSLADRLDVMLTLYEVVYATLPDAAHLEPGALFIPLIEDLVELLSVETWRELWSYVETRSKRFTKDMPASRGKALPLLRIINSFLRFLPRTPEDLVFRGRVHQFASSVISVADKSAINMRGDYNDIRTTWEEAASKVDPVAEGGEGKDAETDEDVKMKDEAVTQEAKEGIEEVEPDFYSTLWSLQQYFANPPSLDGPATGTPSLTPLAQFKAKTDFVLPKLFEQTTQEIATAGSGAEAISPSRKRKREDLDSQTSTAEVEKEIKKGFFHPRYLTGKRLLPHELADPSFRRQILVQYFILFQFLLNLTPASAAKQTFTGGMSKTFVLGTEDQDWVKKKIGTIKEELKRMGRDGKEFESTILSVITRERYYAQWKNEGCPENIFDVPPLADDSAKQAAEGWKRHCGPPPRFPFKLGSRPLSLLWRNGFESIDQLKGWKRASTVFGLDDELRQIEEGEEDDKAMGKELSAEDLAANQELKIKNTWRGLRLASHSHLRLYPHCKDKRDLHRLVAAIKADEAAGLKGLPQVNALATPRSGRGATEEADKPEEDVQVKKEEAEMAQPQEAQVLGSKEAPPVIAGDVDMTG